MTASRLPERPEGSLWNAYVDRCLAADLTRTGWKIAMSVARNVIGYPPDGGFRGPVESRVGRDLIMRSAGVSDTRTFEDGRDECLAKTIFEIESTKGSKTLWRLFHDPEPAGPARQVVETEPAGPARQVAGEPAGQPAGQPAGPARPRIEHSGSDAAAAPAIAEELRCKLDELGTAGELRRHLETEPARALSIIRDVISRPPGSVDRPLGLIRTMFDANEWGQGTTAPVSHTQRPLVDQLTAWIRSVGHQETPDGLLSEIADQERRTGQALTADERAHLVDLHAEIIDPEPVHDREPVAGAPGLKAQALLARTLLRSIDGNAP